MTGTRPARARPPGALPPDPRDISGPVKGLAFVFGLLLASPAAAQFASSLVLESGTDRQIVAPPEIAAAAATLSERGPLVSIQLADQSAERFADLTRRAIGSPLSVQICGTEIIRPVVQSEIKGGQIVFPAPTLDAAERLAGILAGDLGCDALNN